MKFHSNIMDFNISEAVGYLTFKALDKYPYVKYVFSTRFGGVSENEFKSMNLGFSTGDDKKRVEQNYKIFCRATGINYNSLVLSSQIHSDNVYIATSKDFKDNPWEKPVRSGIDSLITNEPGVTIATFYADCMPIFILDPVKRVIALAHSGWRGTLLGIALNTVNKMSKVFGCNAQELICCIGPCIGKCCFEVDAPLYNEFKNNNYPSQDKIIYKKSNDKFLIDLCEANFQTLNNVGIKRENIFVSDLCTSCCKDLLFSHRATNGKRGTMAAMSCISY